MKPRNKTQVVAAIRDELQAQYDRMTTAAREARGYATDQDSKAESKYDTRSLEASYLAVGQSAKADELAAAIRTFAAGALPDLGPTDPIELGALVEVAYPDGGSVAFLLAPRGGGIVLEHAGTTVMVVTPGAPMFQKLEGLRAGDRVEDPAMEIRAVS